MRGAHPSTAVFAAVLCWFAVLMTSVAAERELADDELAEQTLPEGAIEPERLSALLSRASEAAQILMEAPTDATPLQTQRARIDWLLDHVPRITGPVCGLAKKQTDDHLICSVE